MAGGKLSALMVAKAPKPGHYADGGCLYLRVKRSGSKQWFFRYKRTDRATGRIRDHWVGLGGVELFSLAEARQRALELRRLLRMGGDPLAEERARRRGTAGRTFREALEAYLEAHAAKWSNHKHAAQWRSSLEQHAAFLFSEPVTRIDTEAVLRVLKPLWLRLPETASRVRGRIEAVLAYAIVHGWRSGPNPAAWRGHLDALLPSPKAVRPVEHFAALPWQDVPQVWGRLMQSGGM